MLRKNRLFTPGPTPLLPAAQTAMASFTAHHRTADFRALFQRVLVDMKEFIGTKNDVLVLACSGTGVMEASVSNLTSAGDKSSGAHGGKIRRALDGAGQGLRLQRGSVIRALRRDVFAE
jgi:aspartate aminotransferase-like enzyme